MTDRRRLRITEIFLSLQGEARSTGLPTVFVRLTGCPLRCAYCDTEYAFHGGEILGFDEILARIGAFGTDRVCVTGGEPLAQRSCIPFLEELCDAGHSVSLETGGALDIGGVDPRVSRVMDLKTPGSGEAHRNRMENLPLLTARDQVKFVICNRDDYDWACDMLRSRRIPDGCEVLFSPSWGEQDPSELADWILEERLPVRFQVQLHKVLWGDVPGR